MRLHRFYVNKPLGEEIVVERANDEELVHQFLNVFRYKSGDEVFLFSHSTSGLDFKYRITSVSKNRFNLSLVESESNIPSLPITLFLALVKKDTFETIVRQATELGISKIVPVLASRSEKKNLNFQRLSIIAKEATEQCGRGKMPQIEEIMDIATAIGSSDGLINIVGSLKGQKFAIPKIDDSEEMAVWIGPEGGWTEDEEKLFEEHSFILAQTVPTVMRADTAAINLLSVAISSFPYRS